MKRIFFLLITAVITASILTACNQIGLSEETVKASENKGVITEQEQQANKTINEDYQVVASLDEEGITIYAKEMDGLYYDFKIDHNNSSFNEPFWMNVTSPSRPPQIIVEDISGDGTKELIIILTHGYGTGTLIQEAHVYHMENNFHNELLVDNPMAIVLKNVKSTLLPNEAKINIADKQVAVGLEAEPEYLNNEVGFGSIIRYHVKDNQLIANIGAQVSPASFIGDVVIKYEYKDEMYQAKSIEFQTYE
ncbi:hypothetical protein V6C27_09125 [Peptococcaceae bacterium 1198_IL3148]